MKWIKFAIFWYLLLKVTFSAPVSMSKELIIIQKLKEQVEELSEIVSKLLDKESVNRQTKRQAATCILNGNGELINTRPRVL